MYIYICEFFSVTSTDLCCRFITIEEHVAMSKNDIERMQYLVKGNLSTI